MPTSELALASTQSAHSRHPVTGRLRGSAISTTPSSGALAEPQLTWLRMGQLVRLVSIAVVSAALGACSNSETVRDAHEPAPTVGSVEHLEPFVSALMGASYPIEVYLPEGYVDSKKDYPVIYATDAQWSFDGFAAQLQKHKLGVILVGIHDAGRRDNDYLLPGARVYFDFLTTELLPWIEESYRIDAKQRSVVGTSYGGVLAACVLLLDDPETPHFANYLSFDGSFYEHPELTAQLEQQRYATSSTLNATLVLTAASISPSNYGVVTTFTSELSARNYTGLTLLSESFLVDHYAVSDPSFRFVLEELF